MVLTNISVDEFCFPQWKRMETAIAEVLARPDNEHTTRFIINSYIARVTARDEG